MLHTEGDRLERSETNEHAAAPFLPEIIRVRLLPARGGASWNALYVSEYERAIFAAAAFAQKATDCLHGMQSPPSDG
jgi:antirestriction protein ArdC